MKQASVQTIKINDNLCLSGYDKEYVFEKIRTSNNFYEKDILERWFLPHSKDCKIIYDIGANIGNHSVFFAANTQKNAHVYSFEPVPDNFSLLQKNISDNALQEKVSLYQFALGEESGFANMQFESEGNMGTTSISDTGDIDVEVKILDSLNLPKPDFVKIDVEGSELSVLRGMQQLLKESEPILWIEVDLSTAKDTLAFLEDLGYAPVDALLDNDNNVLFAKSNVIIVDKSWTFVSLLIAMKRYRTEYWKGRKAESKYDYEQQKAEDLTVQLGKYKSKYDYEQQKAEDLTVQLGKYKSKYDYEQQKAEGLTIQLGQYKSKYDYEQRKAIELKKQLEQYVSKYTYEQGLVSNLKAEVAKYSISLDELKMRNSQLVDECDKRIEQVDYFKKLSGKHASQYSYEQKKAINLQKQLQELEKRQERYEISKPYKVWKLYQNAKQSVKDKVYFFANRLYHSVAPYPKVLKCFSTLNKVCKFFPDTQKVIFFQDKSISISDEKIINNPSVINIKNNPKQLNDINVAVICDEFTYNSFRYECNLLPLTPDNWRNIFEQNEIDLFFCESAWTGADPDLRPWRGRIYGSVNFAKENRTILFEILEYCKQHNIPTAFWNKEDPTHYEDKVHNFVDTALRFEHIFTTDRKCVERYKQDYQHKSVHLLMFATQPALFNPMEKYDRMNGIIFAGSWYNQHPGRCVEMGGILDNIIKHNIPLIIYNRQSENPDPNHTFPERFLPYLRSRLRHEDLEQAYKGSTMALNINTVTDSDTMFARRVFELMSSNTLVLSNYSNGMEELFGDNVIFIDDNSDLDINNSQQKRINCLYQVLSQHTYKNRFEQIIRTVGIPFVKSKKSVTFIYSVQSLKEAEKAAQHFKKVKWDYKNALFIVNKNVSSKILRECVEIYNSTAIQVVSELYMKKYNSLPAILSDYVVRATSKMKPDFIERAMLHKSYLEDAVGIADGDNDFRIKKNCDAVNVLLPTDKFNFEHSMLDNVYYI